MANAFDKTISALIAIGMIAAIAIASYFLSKIETEPAFKVDLSNHSYGSSVELSKEAERRSRIEAALPFLLSSDSYKSIEDRSARTDVIKSDYLKLFDAALQCYKSNASSLKTVGSAFERDSYLPMLAFAKYAVDYEEYLRVANLESELKKRYAGESLRDASSYFDKLIEEYRRDPRAFDVAVFDVLSAPMDAVLPSGSLAKAAQNHYSDRISSSCELYEKLTQQDPYKTMTRDVRNVVFMRDLESAIVNAKASYDGSKKDMLAFWVLCKLLIDHRIYLDGVPKDVFDESWARVKPLLSDVFLAYLNGIIDRYSKSNPFQP